MIPLPKVLDSNGNEVRRLHPIRVRLNENIVPLSTASIEVIPEEMVEGRTYVEMFNVNGSAGIYRTRAPQIGYGSAKNTINLEHAICEVGDWLVRANIEQVQKTLDAAIRQIFAYYGGSKWQLGTISPSANVVLSCRYSNLLQTINSLLTQVPGAMLTFDFSTKPWTLNVGSREATVSAEGRLSRNVVSAVVTKDDSQLFTRVWLEGLSGGHMDADTIGQYGVIETKLNGSDYTAAQANTIASAYLAKHKRPKYSININGEDFSAMTGETLDRVKIGKKYRLAVDDQPIEENIVSIVWGDVYGSPYDVTINLSEEPDTVISFIQRQYSDTYGVGGVYERAEKQEQKYRHYKEETDQQFTSVYEYIDSADNTLASRIDQNASMISLVVTQSGETGVINTASIVAAINDSGSEVTIHADKINLEGYVTVSQFSAQGFSKFEHIEGERVSGDIVWAGQLWVEDPNIQASARFVPKTINIGGSNYTLLAMQTV